MCLLSLPGIRICSQKILKMTKCRVGYFCTRKIIGHSILLRSIPCVIMGAIGNILIMIRGAFVRILIETEKLPERGPLNIRLDVSITINTTAEEARRKVSVFVGNEIADLLTGEMPDLVWQKGGAYWRVPVILSTRTLGRIGLVGFIDVNVETGERQLSEQTTRGIEENAQRFAAGAAL